MLNFAIKFYLRLSMVRFRKTLDLNENKENEMSKGYLKVPLALICASTLYSGDYTVKAGYGLQNIDGERGTALVVGAGKEIMPIKLDQISGKIAVEAEYSTTLNKPEDDISTSAGTAKDVEESVKAFGVYGVFKTDKINNSKLYARARLGLISYTAKVEGHSIDKSNSQTNVSGGVGLGYEALPNLDVLFDVTSIEQDVRNCTLSVQYKF